MKKFTGIPLLIFVLMVSACSSLPATSTATGQPVNSPIPNTTPTDQADQAAVQVAKSAAASMLNVAAVAVQVQSVQRIDWPDGCMGVVQAGTMCATFVVPGYKIILEVNKTTYEYHTNLDGSQIVLAGGTESPAGPSAGSDQAQAEQTLRAYFSALASRNYTGIIEWYGGSYQVLQNYNPDVRPDDYLTLWQRACTQNGQQCLALRDILSVKKQPDGSYQFLVELKNPDGSLFVQGACCGETTPQSISSFTFRVQKVEGDWKVLDLPPYVP